MKLMLDTKIDRKVAHPTHQFQGQRSRSPRRLMLRSEVHHIFRRERPTTSNLVYTVDGVYRQQTPWPPRSKVKVAMSHGASDRCWPTSRERKVLEPKFVGKLPILRVILRTCFRVKRSKVKVSRETESVSYLRSGKAYELQNRYADGACYQLPAIKAFYEVGFLHAGGAYRVGRIRRSHNNLFIYILLIILL